MAQNKTTLSSTLDSGEGFIDMLFLLLTFFIVQNVWQLTLSEVHHQFIHAQRLDFVKAPDETLRAPNPENNKFIKIILGREFVQFDRGGIIEDPHYIYQRSAQQEQSAPERRIYESSLEALKNVVRNSGYAPHEILVRLYFEREATVTYTVGVYDAINKIGFKSVQWGLESQQKK